MIEFSPDVQANLTPEAMSDLRRLSIDHGINAELIHSLTASKTEARTHLKFFKRMMIISNGLLIFLGLTLAGYGGTRLMGGFSILGLICLIAGVLLFLKFTSVFAGMSKALHATTVVAKKHGLI